VISPCWRRRRGYVDRLHDAPRVKGHVSFFSERVDTSVDTSVDGVLGGRPVTQWSRPW